MFAHQRPEELYKKSRKWAGDIAKKGNNNTRTGSNGFIVANPVKATVLAVETYKKRHLF